MNRGALGLYFVVFLVAAIFVAGYTASRRGNVAAVAWGVLVFLFGAFGVIAWAIWFGFTEGRSRT